MDVRFLPMGDEARSGFYPTPDSVADKLLQGIEWTKISSVLEPSAGKGNLVRAIEQKYRLVANSYYSGRELDIDCVEIDPHLRAVLAYEFQGERLSGLKKRSWELEEKRSYDPELHERRKLPPDEADELRRTNYEIDCLKAGRVHLVHDDFLTYESRKSYDLIVMNPPFSNGDAHLLHAIELQSRNGGQIRCILNAETIRKRHTNLRKTLYSKLEELNAQVSFLEGAFSEGERQTDVEIAIISISIPHKVGKSTIYERLRKAADVDETIPDVTAMSATDFFEQIVTRYNVECDTGIALIREYESIKPYIKGSFEGDPYSGPILSLTIGRGTILDEGTTPSINKYLRVVRMKYWTALFSNKEFVSKLTSNLRKEYMEKVDTMADYDFSLFNIQQVAIDMNAHMQKGIEDTIVELFDEFTQEHSWYPEIKKTIHYFNGWKTNKAHKIGKKVIIPIYGLFSDRYWSNETFKVHEAESKISDIEKVFDYLDGNMTAAVDLYGVLKQACDEGRTRNIPCKYFDVTLYKKGTMHIRFHNQELVDRFNIYCSRKKNWLPPNYGGKQYSNMTEEEREVIDSFHGDGKTGSGEAGYTSVMANAAFFLSEPQSSVLALLPAGYKNGSAST